MREPAPVVHSTYCTTGTYIYKANVDRRRRPVFVLYVAAAIPPCSTSLPLRYTVYQRTSQLPTSHLQCREGEGGRTNCPRWPPPFVCVCVCAVSSPQDKKAVTWGPPSPPPVRREWVGGTGQEGPSRFWWKEGEREEEEEALREGEKPKKTP